MQNKTKDNDITDYINIEEKNITLRNQKVILDSDIADLYDVETRDINKAVKNNLNEFPDGYIFPYNRLKKVFCKKIRRLEKLKYSPNLPKVFTEKEIYTLETIDKAE